MIARFANTGASSIFLFLATLLILSRFASTAFHSPTVFITASVIIALVIVCLTAGRRVAGFGLLAILAFFAVILSWAFATESFYDPGFDGYAYHLSAIWDIAAGWNPFFSPHNNIWVDSYPNGYWVLQSYIVAISGLLMSGQALIVGLMAAMALLSYGFFLEQFNKRLIRFPQLSALILTSILVANPVVIGQILTHYVDAPLYLLGAALAVFLLSDTLSSNCLARLGAVSCIILMVNTKTAALYYVPLIVFGGLLVELGLHHIDGKLLGRGWDWIKSKGLLFGFSFIFGVIVIGYKPYVTNVVDHGQLLYPSVDKIMKGNEPANVIPLPSPMKFAYGLFARTDHSLWPIDAPIELKIPGDFKLSEFKYLRFDTRRGGFGPFFSLAFLTVIASYVFCRIASQTQTNYKWHREGDGFAILGTVMIAASMFFPESWWARYVPFTWLSAVLLAAATLYLEGKGKAQTIKHTLFGIALLSFFCCILASGLGALREGNLLYQRTEKIDFIAQFPEVKILMFYDPPAYRDFQSTSTQDGLSVWTRLLAEQGVETEISRERSQLDCDITGYLNGGIYWCVVIDEMS